jgi:hypothetical protein
MASDEGPQTLNLPAGFGILSGEVGKK